MERLQIVVAQLEKWQPKINLVSPGTMTQIWKRHILDSLQLLDCAQGATQWLDVGSGGGFPGLVIASALSEKAGAHVTLVESNAKKCAFLRETARLAGLPVEVVPQRIEQALPALSRPFDVVSARALAPLVDLLRLTEPVLSKGTLGLFPKGQDVDDEMKTATISWNFDADLIESKTEPGAKVVVIKSASRRL